MTRRRLLAALERLGTALLGPRCHLCGERVYPRDLPAHTAHDHAGDRP